jgi:hypothetical protein
MVDIISIPLGFEVPLLFYIILGTLILMVASVIVFIMFFLKRDFKNLAYKFGVIEGRVKGLGKTMTNAAAWIERLRRNEHNIANLRKETDKDFDRLKDFVSHERTKELSELKDVLTSRMGHEFVNYDRRLSKVERNVEKELKTMKKQMKTTTVDIVRFSLFRMISELSDESNLDSIERKLNDLKTFVKFNKKKKYWNKELQKTVDEFLKDMGKRWKKKKNISTIYNVFSDKMKKL